MQNNSDIHEALSAGDFSLWLYQARNALLEGSGADVACGECVGCCSSSYFIHLKPADAEALKRIPEFLLFPAPNKPNGNFVLGFDSEGGCPMLKNRQCTIYEHRSQTCRVYDCRVFAAAGILAGDEGKATINQRIQRWQFSYPTQRDRDEHAAVQAAATFIRQHADAFPGGRVPTDASQLAILALKVYGVFLAEGEASVARSNTETASAVIAAARKFDENIVESPIRA